MAGHGHWNAIRRVLIACLATVALTAWPPAIGGLFVQAVQAQDVSVSVDFRTGLDPYGRWHRHSRWGEVWIPSRVDRDWRPYKIGRWIYTEDWGWYWASDEDFGWIVYHYGRWVFDPDLGWVWVPAKEWAPAWVQWRSGSQYVGWAPLPPDEIVVEYRDEPDVWVFVRARDFTAPRIATVVLPLRERTVFIRDTVVVNRTMVIRDRGPRIAVNPGIPPAFIAASVGRPLRAYEVRPRVLAGTARIEGAVEVTREELRGRRVERERARIRETQNIIRPADRVPQPKPLGAREEGRLGDNPPRAARGDADRRSPGRAEEERRRGSRDAKGQREQEERQGRKAEEQRQREQQKGREAQEQRQRDQQKAREAQEQRQRDQQKAREAQEQRQRELRRGQEAEEQRQREQRKGREAAEQRQRDQQKAREAQEQRQRELRGGREAAEQRQRDQRQGREAQEQRQRDQQKAREAQAAEQRQRDQRQGREAQEQRQRPGARETEGRGSPLRGPSPNRGPPGARPDRD